MRSSRAAVAPGSGAVKFDSPGQAAGHRGGAVRVVAGQYLGFAANLAASIVGALGAGLPPVTVIPYLGVLPLVLGVCAAWRERHDTADDEPVAATGRGRQCSRSPP